MGLETVGCIEDFWVALELTRDFVTVDTSVLELAEDLRLCWLFHVSKHETMIAC